MNETCENFPLKHGSMLLLKNKADELGKHESFKKDSNQLAWHNRELKLLRCKKMKQRKWLHVQKEFMLIKPFFDRFRTSS